MHSFAGKAVVDAKFGSTETDKLPVKAFLRHPLANLFCTKATRHSLVGFAYWVAADGLLV